MKRRLYMFLLMMATASVLMSSALVHHHHRQSICFVEERCPQDGAINDEHTGHHEDKEQDECQLHKLQKSLTNVKEIKSIHKHIFDGSHLLVAVLPKTAIYIPVAYPDFRIEAGYTMPLSEYCGSGLSQRGPPSIFLI